MSSNNIHKAKLLKKELKKFNNISIMDIEEFLIAMRNNRRQKHFISNYIEDINVANDNPSNNDNKNDELSALKWEKCVCLKWHWDIMMMNQ